MSDLCGDSGSRKGHNTAAFPHPLTQRFKLVHWYSFPHTLWSSNLQPT